jgi:transposase-like protein
MKINCPNPKCVLESPLSPKTKPIVRNGTKFRASDSRYIQRYHCRLCGTYFSRATFDPRFAQKKRRINPVLYRLYCSGVSQRRLARVLRVDRKTIARRIRFLAEEARRALPETRAGYVSSPLTQVQFDDLETSIHTKCKPISVTLAVDPKTRKILDFQVSQMPAKGPLARISRRKYGKRADHRPQGWLRLMHNLKSYVKATATFVSDENPHYPPYLKQHFPAAKHERVPGGRGAITGYGELKKLKFDPLFSLNHTCAMLRANMNRLFRRTWCTSKTPQGLIDHLSLYVLYHNTQLTQAIQTS